jgi:hypothetical protein
VKMERRDYKAGARGTGFRPLVRESNSYLWKHFERRCNVTI